MAVTLGARAFTKIVAKGAAFGSTASFAGTTGEILMQDAVGAVDAGVTVDTNADRSDGVRAANLAGNATVTLKAPVLSLGEAPISMRNLPIYFNSLKAITPSGAGPYTFAYSPSMTDVDTLTPQSFLLQDGVGKWIIDGCTPGELTLSAAADGMLQLGSTWNGRLLATTSDANTAAVAAGQYFLPGRLFTMKTHTAFLNAAGTGGSSYGGYLTDWSMTLTPGAQPVMAMSGSLNYGGVAYQGGYAGTLSLTLASDSSQASSFPFTDIGTQKFVWLSAVDANGYGVTVSVSAVLTNVSVIGSEGDGGVILNTVEFELAYDSTSGKLVEVTMLSPLSTCP